MKHILRILLLINLLLAITYQVSAEENNIYWALDEVGNNSYSLTISSKEIEGEHYQSDVFDNSTSTQYVPWTNWSSSVKYVYIGDRNDIVKPDSMHYWFSGMYQLESIDFTYLDTSNVTDMSGLFSGSGLKTIDFGNFNTSKVVDMNKMFQNANLLTTLDLSSFDTSKVVNMSNMFYGCGKLESINLSSFNTSEVTDMSYMFSGCNKLISLDLSSFNTSKVTDMSYMFNYCEKLSSLNISSFNTKNVTTMTHMFNNSTELTSLNLSNFDTSKVIDMSYMFNKCLKLSSLNVSSFNTTSVTNMDSMFNSCEKLETLNVSNFDTKNVVNMYYMFGNCSSLKTLNLSNFNTEKVTNMKYIFSGCNSLESLNISNFNTTKVTDMSGMFRDCIHLKTLDLSSFDTTKVTDMTSMFYNDYRLQVIKVSDTWSTRKAGNSYDIFGGCYSLIGMNGTTGLDNNTITYARIDTEENPGLLWDHIPSTLQPTIKWAVDGENNSCISGEGTCKLTLSNNEISGTHLREGEFIYMNGSPWYSYSHYIKEIQVGGENDIIKPFKTMRSWFYSFFEVDLLDLRYLDTSNVEDMSELFLDSSFDVIVVSNRWDTSKVEQSGSMFQSICNPIIGQYGTTYDTTKIDKTYARVDTKDNPGYLWDHIPNKIYWAVDGTFCEENGECSLKISSKEIPGNHYKTGYVDELHSYGIPKNYSIKEITIGGENDIISVMSTYSLFSGYYIKELDLTYLDTSRVRDMSYMFSGNQYLRKINLGSLDTSRVTDMSYMFYDNENIVDIDLSNFDTSNVTNMDSMFSQIRNIKYLDLRSFDTSKVENMNNMFSSDYSLEQVAVSDKWDTSKVTESNSMFYGCDKIKGKNGTTRVGESNELTYARLDEVGKPGYFTDTIDRTIFSLDAPVVEFTKGKDGEINLKFNYVEDALGYNIYRKGYYFWGNSNKGTWQKIATLTNNEYLDKNVTVDYLYTYRITAFNNGGESPYSNEIEKHIERPNKVQNVKVVKGSKNSIKISWDKEPYQGYYVYMGTSKDNMKRVAVINKASQNYYEAKNLKENKKYYFKVKAFAIVKDAWIFGVGDVFEARTAPKTPSVSIKRNSYNSIKVVINKQSGATKYVIQRSTNSKNGFKTIATVEDLNYLDLDLTPNRKYYYKVKACNNSNICSSYTKALEGKPTLGKPGVTLKTSSKKVTITLGRVADADGYQIYRATSKKGKYSKIATLLSEEELLSYIDKTKKGKTYYYKVRAYKVINESRVYGPYTGIKSIKSK